MKDGLNKIKKLNTDSQKKTEEMRKVPLIKPEAFLQAETI